MRKIDIVFAVILVAIAVTFSGAILSMQKPTIIYNPQGTITAVPMPEWTRYKMGATGV